MLMESRFHVNIATENQAIGREKTKKHISWLKADICYMKVAFSSYVLILVQL